MSDLGVTLHRIKQDRDTGVLDALCADLGLELLVLFGSARHAPDAAHDIDLGYSFARREGGDDLAVVNALGARYGDALDLMPLARADAVALYEALAHGEILVELRDGSFAEQQLRAFGLYRDTERFRRLQLEALAS